MRSRVPPSFPPPLFKVERWVVVCFPECTFTSPFPSSSRTRYPSPFFTEFRKARWRPPPPNTAIVFLPLLTWRRRSSGCSSPPFSLSETAWSAGTGEGPSFKQRLKGRSFFPPGDQNSAFVTQRIFRAEPFFVHNGIMDRKVPSSPPGVGSPYGQWTISCSLP